MVLLIVIACYFHLNDKGLKRILYMYIFFLSLETHFILNSDGVIPTVVKRNLNSFYSRQFFWSIIHALDYTVNYE